MGAELALQLINEQLGLPVNKKLLESVDVSERERNLKDWNMRQAVLLTNLHDMGIISTTDTEKMVELFTWFYMFVDEHRKYPTINDAISQFS